LYQVRSLLFVESKEHLNDVSKQVWWQKEMLQQEKLKGRTYRVWLLPSLIANESLNLSFINNTINKKCNNHKLAFINQPSPIFTHDYLSCLQIKLFPKIMLKTSIRWFLVSNCIIWWYSWHYLMTVSWNSFIRRSTLKSS